MHTKVSLEVSNLNSGKPVSTTEDNSEPNQQERLKKLVQNENYKFWLGGENLHNNKLNPYWVTGFTDGEGSFRVRIRKDSRSRVGWAVALVFQLTVHLKDYMILEQLKSYFGVGKIYNQDSKRAAVFMVESLKDLIYIVDHFDKYPLITQKREDYVLWRRAVEIVNKKEHLTLEGLQIIVALRASLNLGLSDQLKEAFSNVIPVPKPVATNQQILDPNWIAGFTSAEGNFLVNIFSSPNSKLKKRVKLEFSIVQHVRDKELMSKLTENLGCGGIYLKGGVAVHLTSKLPDVTNIIIPFFKKHAILGTKSKDFEDWCRVALLMGEKKHLTQEGLDKISLIKAKMNRGRIE